jgi:glycosyltransferase involved in cell wall biosynthesis
MNTSLTGYQTDLHSGRGTDARADGQTDELGTSPDPIQPHHRPTQGPADTRRPTSPRFYTGVSVVLPAYNEEEAIESTIRHVAEVMTALVSDFEIVVTNDGSKDRTGEILGALQLERALHLRVVTHQRNQGYGAALASGFDAADSSLIFFTDGDRQFDVAELAGFLPAMDPETDMVIGWRRERADPFMRLVNAWGWKQLVNGLFGYTAKDVDCAFKLFRREVWHSLVVHARGASFSAEFLIKARRLGFHVVELPVSHYPRTVGSATGAKPAVIARAFKELFSLWRSLDRQLAADSRERPPLGRARHALAR